ncbi:MAG: lipopolysaccharide transport periplasmic protein LptA [Desulfobacterales bacterium]|nr:lipopolysaccharide transport periplasmic protein LptA [Desulfobacterales bacterium]
MRISLFNGKFFYVFLICMIILSLSINTALAGKDTESNTPENEDNKIHITSDRLESDSETKYAEFIGNVVATQGKTVIRTDSLKIFYNTPGEGGKNAVLEDKGAIDKIEATGNVHITFDNRVAVAEQAVYNAEKGELVLSGENTKITSGNNTISGSQITLYREDGRIRVESDETKRVEGIIFPDKDMNFDLEQPGSKKKLDNSESDIQAEQTEDIREINDQAAEN